MSLIQIKNLKFSYPHQKSILQIPTFFLNKGEKVFLYGPSGCGKSTFLEILAGILIPEAESFEFLNCNVLNFSTKQRDQFRADHLGYIFQNFNLIPYLSVLENIQLPLYLSVQKRKNLDLSQEKSELMRICKALGIADLVSKTVHQLSVGQQQRVAVARALAGKPELILADEPTSALDQDHREMFLQLLFKESRSCGASVLFVSHDRSLQSQFDRSISFEELNHRGGL